MAANKKISELAVLADSGNPVLIETVRDGANFKLLCNLTATAAPTVTNDSSEGYSVGSIWNFGGVVYTATDVSVGAAVWVAVGGTYSIETLTPVITIGTGSALDFKCIFRKEGNFVSFDGICRVLTIADTESIMNLTIELPALFAPVADFTNSAQFFGGVYPVVYENANGIISSIQAVSDIGSKKLLISISLIAAASGDYETPLTIRGTYQIVV
jgi:hypothetical protein